MATTEEFAIACDSGCDLSPSFLEERGVSLVDVSEGGGGSDVRAALAAAYRSLAERGARGVVSVHSARALDPVLGCAEAAAKELSDLIDVHALDTGLLSLATGMVAERLSSYRAQGATLDEAMAAASSFATTVRLLLIPSSPAWLSRHRERRHDVGRIGRVTSRLRVRLSGERGLFLVSHGVVTHLARDTEVVELTSRLAHAVSAVYAAYGPLVYAKIEADDPRCMRSLEKSLNTNEFEARCLGKVRLAPENERLLGPGTVGVVVAPESSFSASFRTLVEGHAAKAAAAPDDKS